MKTLIASLQNPATAQESTSPRPAPIHARGPICGRHIGTATGRRLPAELSRAGGDCLRLMGAARMFLKGKGRNREPGGRPAVCVVTMENVKTLWRGEA